MSAIAKSGALTTLAQRLNIDEAEVQSIVINTLMKAKGGNQQVSNAWFLTVKKPCLWRVSGILKII